MYGEGANTCDVGGLQRSEHRVFQQTGPQTLHEHAAAFDAQRRRHLAAVEHARFVEHAREARQRLRRRVQGGMERLPLRGVEAEPLTVR